MTRVGGCFQIEIKQLRRVFFYILHELTHLSIKIENVSASGKLRLLNHRFLQ